VWSHRQTQPTEVRTMHTTLSISELPASLGERVSRPACWCGQDLEYVDGSHCPRCGSSGSTWSGR
jgi:hypothetical protein